VKGEGWEPREQGVRPTDVNPITHGLVGWMVAGTVRNLDRQDRTLITLAAVAPDLDGFGLVPELITRHSSDPLLWWTEFHHVLLHNVTASTVMGTLILVASRRKGWTTVLSFASIHLHLLGDLVGSRGPDGYVWTIPYLSFFSYRWEWSWSGQWELNGWQNIALSIVLLGATFALAWERGYSPVGLFCERGDKLFIETLRRRLGRVNNQSSCTNENDGSPRPVSCGKPSIETELAQSSP